MYVKLYVHKLLDFLNINIFKIYFKNRGVSRVVKARFNRLTRVNNVEPFAYEDE